MQITKFMDLDELAERMGGTPAPAEVEAFQALLLVRGIADTDDVSEDEWVRLQEENVRVQAEGYRACVACGEPVLAPTPGTVAQAHRGHVEESRDRTCGTWGWGWRTADEDQAEAHP